MTYFARFNKSGKTTLFPGVSSRWLASEIQELVLAYTKGATDAELMLLVRDLIARRKA